MSAMNLGRRQSELRGELPTTGGTNTNYRQVNRIWHGRDRFFSFWDGIDDQPRKKLSANSEPGPAPASNSPNDWANPNLTFEQAIQFLDDNQTEQIEVACTYLLKFVSPNSESSEARIQTVIDSGCVIKLINLIKDPMKMQVKALGPLGILTFGNNSQIVALVELGIIPILVSLISHELIPVQYQASHALGNIADVSTKYRDQIVQAGALSPLLEHCQNAAACVEIHSVCLRTIQRLCSGEPKPDFKLVQSVVPILVQFLFSKTDSIVEVSLKAFLSLLEDDPPNVDKIRTIAADPKLIPQLVLLLKHSDSDIQFLTLRTLGSIAPAADSRIFKLICTLVIPAIVKLLSHSVIGVVAQDAFWFLANFTARHDPETIELVVNTGVIPILIQQMKESNILDIQIATTWAISNLCAGGFEQTDLIVKSGAIPLFIQSLKHDQFDVQEYAASGLGNIAATSDLHRDAVIQAGALEILLECGQKSGAPVKIVQNVTGAIRFMCEFEDEPKPDFNVLKSAIPFLAQLLNSEDPKTLESAVLAIYFLMDANHEQISEILAEPTILPELVKLLNHPNPVIHTRILKALACMVCGDNDRHKIELIQSGAIPEIVHYLFYPHATIRQTAGGILLHCTNQDLPALIDLDIFKQVSSIIVENEIEWGEGIFVLSNAAENANQEQMKYLVEECSLMKLLIDALKPDLAGGPLEGIILTGLRHILLTGCANDSSPNPKLYHQQFRKLGGVKKLRVIPKAKTLFTEFFKDSNKDKSP